MRDLRVDVEVKQESSERLLRPPVRRAPTTPRRRVLHHTHRRESTLHLLTANDPRAEKSDMRSGRVPFAELPVLIEDLLGRPVRY